MIYFTIFLEFLKVGLFSVGGGLTTIPFLRVLADKYDWFTVAELMDIIAVAESAPGPIGINAVTYAGFKAAGVLGGVVSTLSLILPSVIIVIIVSHFLNKFKESATVNNILYGIRPASAGLVAGAVLTLLLLSVYSDGLSVRALVVYIIFTIACFFSEKEGIKRFKVKKAHPLLIIAAGAVVGILTNN
ncbi:MAG: chromate transporter [Oscillospiraceae bacterium]|nr:chromate transporter [Oscillospiraceae bacterium]